MITRGNVRYNSDGTIDIIVDPDGLPSATAIIPAPFMSEDSRQKQIEEARTELILDGRWIESERRIRNQVFDKKGEKTTTEFQFRTCKNKEEVEIICKKIKKILKSRQA